MTKIREFDSSDPRKFIKEDGYRQMKDREDEAKLKPSIPNYSHPYNDPNWVNSISNS